MSTTNYDAIDSRMNIDIRSVALAHPPMLADILTRMTCYTTEAKQVTITCNAPERDGSLHYSVHIEYIRGGRIMVGALRREIGAETEFHS